MDIETLKFDENGLIPAVVQDFLTGEVLMVAYMNRESLEMTLRDKLMTYWSRSRRPPRSSEAPIAKDFSRRPTPTTKPSACAN